MSHSEPWLRGILPDLDPVIGHLIRSSQQIREEVDQALTGLDSEAVAPARFHARHLAGSTRRLCAYLAGRGLDPGELAALANESSGNESAAELIRLVNEALDRYEHQIRALDPATFATIRHVGRARLPVTAIGLAIHIAEHGQRHAGQLVSTLKLTRGRSEAANTR